MRVFAWSAGAIKPGIEIRADERLGPVVFLGEEGRGRRYEKVAMARHRPADVDPVGHRVMDAVPEKITLPASNGRPEKIFFVLARPARPSEDVMVRICTYTSYVRGGNGCWRTVAGEPTEIVSGYGAFGDAGRVGNWKDGLVIFHPGDVLRVYPSRGFGGHDSWAVWMEGGVPKTLPFEEYERELALGQAKAIIAQAASGETALRVAFGRMPAVTYAGGGKVEAGIKVAGGTAIALGEEGRGRARTEVPLIGFTAGERVAEAAVALLSEKEKKAAYSWEKPTTERLYGLVTSQTVEAGAMLLHVAPGGTHRTWSRVKAFRGEPTKLADGVFASGIAGAAGSSDDTLWVLRSGEALVIEGGQGNLRVLENRGGTLATPVWKEWEEIDGKANPSTYVEKGQAPWGHVPAEWIGRVVEVERWVEDTDRYGQPAGRRLGAVHEGELVEIRKDSIVLNLGWDGRDRQLVVVTVGVWVKLDPTKTVKAAEPARVKVQAEAATLRAEAAEVNGQGYFACLEISLQHETFRVSEGRLDSNRSDGRFDFAAATAEGIGRWVEWARGVMSRVREAQPAAEELHRRQSGGEVLANFSRDCAQVYSTDKYVEAWVIRPDGSCRDSDNRSVWLLVAAEELAIAWSKAYTAADHVFVVAKLPVGGLTEAQRETVTRLERKLAEEWDGAVGMSGRTTSPPVGKGWGLVTPKPAATPAAKSASRPMSAEEREMLLGKWGRR